MLFMLRGKNGNGMTISLKFETVLDGIDYIEKNFTVIDTINIDQYVTSPIELYLRLQKNYKNEY
jgi:hypothetical protein